MTYFQHSFHIDVTFEMRTVRYTIAFIQLTMISDDQGDFISNRERGQEDKIAERQRESKGERANEGWGRIRHQL